MCWWQLELKRTRRCMLRPAGARAQSMLALEWREWMTRRVTGEYLANRAFYQVQAGALVDNPDQRIASDVRCAPAPHPCPRAGSLPRVFLCVRDCMGTAWNPGATTLCRSSPGESALLPPLRLLRARTQAR